MAIFTNLDEVTADVHGMFESSNLKATVVGNLYDSLVIDENEEEIAVDNGVALKMGEYTHNDDGLQERYATIATVSDKIAVTGSPAVVKDAFTTAQAAEYNFYHKAGTLAKTYEVVEDDIFAVADYQFTSGDPVVDSYVTVDGTGGWVATEDEPDASSYGFIGKIHSIANNDFYPMIRIRAIQNVQL